MTQDKIDYSKLAEQIDSEQIAAELDTGRIGSTDRFMVTKRQLAALAGSGLGAGVLAALGIDSVDAQTSGQSGTVGSSSAKVDVEAQDINSTTITNTGQIDTATLISDLVSTTPSNPGTTKTIEKTKFASNAFHAVQSQRTESVSTSGKIIFDSSQADLGRGHDVTVYGQDTSSSTSTFTDKVQFQRSGGLNVSTRSGVTPASRSYSTTGNSEISLSMSSGNFDIITVGFSFRSQ
jgi:hypothetical protein